MKQNMVPFIVLGLLMDGEKSGYELKSNLLETTGQFYAPSFGSIYPILKKHEEHGFVSGNKITVGKKSKTLYTITETGINEFMEWLEEPFTQEDIQYSVEDTMVRLWFYRYLPDDTAIDLLCKVKKLSQSNFENLSRIEQEDRSIPMDSRRWPLEWGVFCYGAFIQFLDKVISMYEKK